MLRQRRLLYFSVAALGAVVYLVTLYKLHLQTQDCQQRLSQERKAFLHVTKSPVPEQLRSVTVYMITPTYARWTQKADLTRLCQTLMHVRQIHWIVVEDAVSPTPLVTKLLRRCTVPSTHLHTRTPERLRLKGGEPTWRKCRGVEQRNAGLEWLRRNVGNEEGVVYFGDDDNTYDVELFEQMRDTKKVSVWPVGICGGLRFEGPLCKNDKVTGWHTGWALERPFPIDMAGFAISLPLLVSRTNARLDPDAKIGYLESSILEKLVAIDELEPKASNCTKVFVWHTRTEVPKLTHEQKLIEANMPSNPDIET